MVRFCANVSMLFSEVPFLERFGLARSAGFNAVEFQFPYVFSAADIAEQVQRNDLQVVLFNLPLGNTANGDRGLANNPSRKDDFRRSLDLALEYAHVLKPAKMNCPAGLTVPGMDHQTQWDCLKENLRIAADATRNAGIAMVIEPLNPFDAPGFFLSKPSDGFQLIEEINHPNLKLEYDIYHAQRTEGQITSSIRDHIDQIGHLQLADAPDRNEPGTGELNWAYIFAAIEESGYDDYIGLEYKPSLALTVDTLTWMEAYRT